MQKKRIIRSSSVGSRAAAQFRQLFYEALTSTQGPLNRMYIGEGPRVMWRSTIRDELIKDNPKLSKEKISELLEEEMKKEEMPHYEFAQRLAGDPLRFKKSLTKKDANAYDFVWCDDISRIESYSGKNYRARKVKYKNNKIRFILEPKKEKHGKVQLLDRYSTSVRRLPSDVKEIVVDDEKYFISDGFENVLKHAELLNKTGHLLIFSRERDAEALTSGVQELSLESVLNSRGYFINAIIGENRSRYPCFIYIISRNDNSSIFLADLNYANEFRIEPLSKPSLEASDKVSHFDPEVPEHIVTKMQQGDFPDPGDLEANPPSSIDLLGQTPSEACKSIMYFLFFHRNERFIHIQIFHDFDIDERDALLKSQVALYLEKHPQVLAFCSCSEKYGGTGAFFVHLNSEYSSPIISNFLSGGVTEDKGNNLTEGYFLSRKEFYSLSSERAKSEVAKNIFRYDGYKEYLFQELLSIDLMEKYQEDLTAGKQESEEYAENKIGILTETNSRFDDADFPKIALTHESYIDRYNRYFTFPLDSKFLAEYVAIFLNSAIGRQIYLSHVKKDAKKLRSSHIDNDDLVNFIILVPDIKTQERTIRAHNKVKKLQFSINEFKDGLSQNPAKVLTEKLNQIDEMLDIAGDLNFADKVKSTLRLGERGTGEWKETWRLPIDKPDDKEEQQKITTVPFKAINAFLNSGGGRLIIGVKDETSDIVGLEAELGHFFDYKTKELGKQQEMFMSLFNAKLRNAFNLNESQIEKLIHSEWGIVDNKAVFMVECKALEKGDICLIRDPKLLKYLKEAYIRISSDSIPMTMETMAHHLTS